MIAGPPAISQTAWLKLSRLLRDPRCSYSVNCQFSSPSREVVIELVAHLSLAENAQKQRTIATTSGTHHKTHVFSEGDHSFLLCRTPQPLADGGRPGRRPRKCGSAKLAPEYTI